MPSRFSFEVVNALDYDELRPEYAPEAVAWVAERGGLASSPERQRRSHSRMPRSTPSSLETRSTTSTARAFVEIRRILRPGRVLALFWAWPLEEQNLRYPKLREVDEVVEATRASCAIAAAYRAWSKPPRAVEGFGRFERRAFPITHVVPSARLPDLYATSSDVASLPDAARVDLLGRIRQLSRGLPEVLQLPARTVVDLNLSLRSRA